MGNAEKDDLAEGFPARLITVIRKVKRNGALHDQVFHVKKARPGDRYAMARHKIRGRRRMMEGPEDVQVAPVEQDALPADPSAQGQAQALQGDPAQALMPQAPPPPKRIEVQPLEIPWGFAEAASPRGEDPISPELRHRFSPENKAARVTSPVVVAAPADIVRPNDQMLWGVVEPELVDRLRGGRLTKLRFSGGESGALFSKIEGGDGYIHKAYVRPESLVDPFFYDAFGLLYAIDRTAGGMSRRAAAAYEIAKAMGFDDLVPPTVARYDEFGDLDPILSSELIERKSHFCESIARTTGDDPAKIKRVMGGFSSVQLFVDGLKTLESEKYFSGIFSAPGEEDQKDTLNRIFDVMPEARRVGFVRASVLDFVMWTADRPLASMAFSSDRSHPVVLFDNELILPDPRVVLEAYKKIQSGYLDEETAHPDAIPLLWSDPVMMVAIRGREDEMRVYEEVGARAVKMMQEDRSKELVRSLSELQVPLDSIAAMFARLFMMSSAARMVARDPYLFCLYLVALASGSEVVDEMLLVEKSVNDVMSSAIGRDYSFSDALLSGGDDGLG